MGPDFWHPTGAKTDGKWGPSCDRMAVTVLRVLGSNLAIPRPMRPCARPGFDGRPELCPVGGGDAEPDRGAGGAEGLARGEDHRDPGVLALLTELIFEGFGHIVLHTSECTSYFQCSQASGGAAPGSGGGALARSAGPGSRPFRSRRVCRDRHTRWTGSGTTSKLLAPMTASCGSLSGVGSLRTFGLTVKLLNRMQRTLNGQPSGLTA